MLAYLIVLVVLAVAISAIAAPLRTARHKLADEKRLAEIAELEAARDQKLTEIRDAELDLRTGKLSEEDWGRVDGGLRAEAIEILHRLDSAEQDEAAATARDEPLPAEGDRAAAR